MAGCLEQSKLYTRTVDGLVQSAQMKLSGSKIVISFFLFGLSTCNFLFDSYLSLDLPHKISLSYMKNFCLGRIFKQPNQIGKYQIEFTMLLVNIPTEKTFIR
jgi:hypothetical protein